MAIAPQEKIVSEIIGRVSSPFRRTLTLATKSVDETAPDYPFWSYLRRGKQRGYQIGALFTKRICEVDAEWTIGRGFSVETDNPDVDEMVSCFVRDSLNTIMTWRKDASGLGDGYIVVNADASLTMINPDTVQIIPNPLDYTQILEYKITTVFNAGTIIDEYFIDKRIVTVKEAGKPDFTQIYPNLFGRFPVIHLPNDKETNELYGHPIYEALLTLFARYDDVIQKSLDGVEVMGRPIPVAEGLKDPTLAKKDNSTRTETVYTPDGSTETVDVVDFEDLTMLWLGEGASFKFASPNPFSADSVAMLKKLFYLMMEHIGIPEWAWGGAVAGGIGGDAVSSQMPAFIRYLEGRRLQIQPRLKDLIEVWLIAKSFIEPVPAYEEVEISWPELDKTDGTLLLEKIKYAHGSGLITAVSALRLLELVDDPESEVEDAGEEQANNEEAMQAELDSMMAERAKADQAAQTSGEMPMKPAQAA